MHLWKTMEEKDGFLQIPECHVPYNVTVKFLYVRQSYKDLHQLISTEYAENNVIITGTPGVGKSLFALYELYLAIKEGKNVVFQHEPSHTTSVFDNQRKIAFETDPAGVAPYLKERDTVYLYDAATRAEAQYRSWRGRILVFSSPNNSNYAEVLKERETIMLYMPTWSWSEICLVLPKTDIEEGTAQKMFDKFGGVARYIFTKSRDTRTQRKKKLNDLIARVDNPSFLIDLGHQSTDKSHHLFHHIVRDDNYIESNIDFASKWVQKKVYKTLIRTQKDNVFRFLAASAETSALAIIRGRMFESHCHQLLSEQNSFKARKLVKKSAPQPDVWFEAFTARPIVYFKKNEELGEPSNSDKYMVPCAKNYESVDAIIPCCNQAFQMTVSERHPVKANGIISVMDSCKLTNLKLFFVVPSDVFPKFVEQNLTGGSLGNRQVEQYALCIDTSFQS